MKHTKLILSLMSMILLITVTGCDYGSVDSEQSIKPTNGEVSTTEIPTVSKAPDVTTSDDVGVVSTQSSTSTNVEVTTTEIPTVSEVPSGPDSDIGKCLGGSFETYDKAWEIVSNRDVSIQEISELRESLLKYELFTDVQVFLNSSDSDNSELQVFEGKVIPNETCVTIFYDDNVSWMSFIYLPEF